MSWYCRSSESFIFTSLIVYCLILPGAAVMMRPVFVSVTTVNSQYITIKKGESRGREAIANVVRIKFHGDLWWPTYDG